MAADASNVHSWAGAAVYAGPVGTTAPTDVTTALDAAFLDMGFIAEDGITRGVEHETDRHYGIHLQGSVLLKTSKRNFRPFFTFMPLEHDSDVVHLLLNPDADISDDATTQVREFTVPKYDERAWIIEQVEGDTVRRMHFPRGLVSEQGDLEDSPEGISPVEITIDLIATAGVYGVELSAV